jgi:hypothetical protein
MDSIDKTKLYQATYREKNKDARNAWHRENYAKNKEAIKATKKEYRAANAEDIKAKNKADYEKHRERYLAQKKEYRALNKGKINALNAARKKVIKQQTPKWVGTTDKWFILETYELAALRTEMFGFSWNVDHIIPLQGKIVSGLHVPNNLQVIPAIENIRKKNKYEVTHVC